jgi:hypothetical protein
LVRNPCFQGRAIARAVSRRLSTAAARARARVRSCEIYGGQSGTGAVFLLVLRFPLPIRIPLIAPQSSLSSITRGWYNRPNSGRSTKWAQSHPMRKKKSLFSPSYSQNSSQLFRLIRYTTSSFSAIDEFLVSRRNRTFSGPDLSMPQ